MAQSSGDGADELTEDAEESSRSPQTVAFWADVRVDPVEIALPAGVGYTLRAYRPADELAEPEVDGDPELAKDDFDAAHAAVAATRRRGEPEEDEIGEIQWPEEFAEEPEEAEADEDSEEAAEEDEAEAEEKDEKEEEEEETEAEDVPVFLGRRGRVYLFRSADKLVEFVRSGADHDLSQLDTWSQVSARIKPADIDPVEGDRYELDLVVKNLRGGADQWDPTLIIKAGEVARDLAYALRIDAVLTALAPGSPLDDLDEALRTAEAGGLKAMFARRKLRKAGGQQAVLGWRTIIGKLAAVADWRD